MTIPYESFPIGNSSGPLQHIRDGKQLIGLGEAARSLPGGRGNSHTNPSTVYRWITRGCRAVDGSKVRLEAARVGGRWVTSREALARFAAALSAPPPADHLPRPPAEVRRATSTAAEELTRLGV